MNEPVVFHLNGFNKEIKLSNIVIDGISYINMILMRVQCRSQTAIDIRLVHSCSGQNRIKSGCKTNGRIK